MENTTKHNYIEIPSETTRIITEYYKFSQYMQKHTKKWIDLRWFMSWLQDNGYLEVTEDGLYKIKDDVEFTYEK